jgi:hypothetical protein
MSRILPVLYKAFYVSIFFAALRKIHTKIVLMFDDCIPVVKEDDEDWYAVRLYHRYFIYDGMSKSFARTLAMSIYKEIPELRGHIEVVEHDDPEVTLFENIPHLPRGAGDTMTYIYNELDSD